MQAHGVKRAALEMCQQPAPMPLSFLWHPPLGDAWAFFRSYSIATPVHAASPPP